MLFDGYYSFVLIIRSEEYIIGVEGIVGGGVLGFEFLSIFKWEQKIIEEIMVVIYVVGGIFIDLEWFLIENSVLWSVIENEYRKSGILVVMCVGIFVKCFNDEDFQCLVKLKISVDFKIEWQEVFKKYQGDDVLIFKLLLLLMNMLMKYDMKNFGSFNMVDIEQVMMIMVLEDVIKIMKIQV